MAFDSIDIPTDSPVELFTAFINCRYKALLRLTGETGDPSAYELMTKSLNARYRQEVVTRLSQSFEAKELLLQSSSLDTAVRSGCRLLLDVGVGNPEHAWTLPIVERLERPGREKGIEFVPIRFTASARPSSVDKLLALADGLLLAEQPGIVVRHAKIISGPTYSVAKLNLCTHHGPTKLASEARRSLIDLAALIARSAPGPKLVLNKHCGVCEFNERCRTDAEDRDDLSLLRGLTQSEVASLNERGVFTTTQLAYTFRAKSIGRGRQQKKHSQPLQARAFRDKTVYVASKPELPDSHVRAYLDVEGIPDKDFYYLIGVVIDGPDGTTPHQFWADTDGDEGRIWHDLLDLLVTHNDCPVFHFGRYERDFCRQMEKRHGCGRFQEEALLSRLFDLHAAIRTRVFFPAYSNGLKSIACSLGATWTGPISSGLESIAWRYNWETHGQPDFKAELLRYNCEDCLAVKKVADFLSGLTSDGKGTGPPTDPVSVIRDHTRRSFGNVRFALPEIGRITKCAYFNYQRDKVYLRKHPKPRITPQRRKAFRRQLRINARVECSPPAHCPRCGMCPMRKYDSGRHHRVVRDLRFTGSGVRRFAIEYSTCRYECRSCRFTCYSPDFPTGEPQFGYNLASWAVYQQVALRQSSAAVVDSINEVFGYTFSHSLSLRVCNWLAKHYEATEQGLLEYLRRGRVMCADEAKIQFRGGIGYVWVFSNEQEVIYRFSRNREGAILQEVLGDFQGVLVSDFYAAYDSVQCPQQKCLIHLIRDINDDLLKAPFDEELKTLAARLTELLRSIVECIDRYGLKRRHLHKFAPEATSYCSWLAEQTYQSAAAIGYQKRIGKYGGRLFTFLDHDRVPWNNNLAENAVKLIVSRRRLFGASFSDHGIKDYLRFLSLYQTLRRKGRSLLRFLLSKETDIVKYRPGRLPSPLFRARVIDDC